MSQRTIVHINDDFTSIIDVHEKKGHYTFSAPKHFSEPQEVSRYLLSKKNIYLLFSSDAPIEESITLPSIITNEATLLSALNTKLHDNHTTHEALILNRLHTDIDATGESATHYYEGLYEKEVLRAIAPVPNLEHLKCISTERYALFALAEHAFKGKSYLCVYTQEKKNLIIAVQNEILLFARIGILESTDEIEKVMEQISDINRTVSYVHQQFREAKFEFIAICGTIADGEIVPTHLQSLTGLHVTVLSPTLMVNGLGSNISQTTVLELGMLYVNASMSFIPDRVKAAREFYLGGMIGMALAFFLMLFGLYQSANSYVSYQESLNDYTTAETQLVQTLRHTDTLSTVQLQEITTQLKSSTPLNHHFIDDVIPFENLLKLIKPNELSFEEQNGTGKLAMSFKHTCKTLLELYLFEKNFKHEVSALRETHVLPTYQTDYNTLTFQSTLNIGGESQ